MRSVTSDQPLSEDTEARGHLRSRLLGPYTRSLKHSKRRKSRRRFSRLRR